MIVLTNWTLTIYVRHLSEAMNADRVYFANRHQQTVTMYSVSGVFRISQGGDTSMWWGAGEGSGEGTVRAPYLEKKSIFYVPKMIILGAF